MMHAAPVIQRRAELHKGAIFAHAGRLLRVVRAVGSDPAAPVIVEELGAVGQALPGQYALWAHDAVLNLVFAPPAPRKSGAQLSLL